HSLHPPVYLLFSLHLHPPPHHPPSFPTRRSSDLRFSQLTRMPSTSRPSQIPLHTMPKSGIDAASEPACGLVRPKQGISSPFARRSEEHTSELQSRENLVCRLLLEKKKKKTQRESE